MASSASHKICCIIFCCFICNISQADDWTFKDDPPDNTSSVSPLPSGQVLKWCEINGKKIRYSSQNVPGYKICGEIKAEASCDPTGKRFISARKDSKTPYTFKDCSIKDRLVVKRLDPFGQELPPVEVPPLTESSTTSLSSVGELVKDFSSKGSKDSSAMSVEEILKARGEFRKLEEKQNGDLSQGIADSLNQFVESVLGKDGVLNLINRTLHDQHHTR
jgi:hypothetical protein